MSDVEKINRIVDEVAEAYLSDLDELIHGMLGLMYRKFCAGGISATTSFGKSVSCEWLVAEKLLRQVISETVPEARLLSLIRILKVFEGGV